MNIQVKISKGELPLYLGIISFFMILTGTLFGQHGLVIDSMKAGGADGIYIIYAHDDGIHIRSTFGDGVYVERANDDGIHVLTAVENGLHIGNAFGHGIYISYADNDGFNVQNTAGHGLTVQHAGSHGINVQKAAVHGISVSQADGAGVLVGTTGLSCFYVDSAGTNGVHVGKAGQDGVYVYQADDYSINIQGDKNAGEAHIAQIYNRSAGNNADVLRLQLGRTSDLTASNNFITYYDGNNTKLGEVQGNGSGGICHTTSGCDYAEYLPVADQKINFQPGDVVGVYNGKISHHTQGTSQVMVITDKAAVLGNMPTEDQIDNFQAVSFIGQIPVRVQGPVQVGDWIVASGNQDGLAIAVSTALLTPDHQIVGRAWESSADPGVKRVNTAVGLDHSEVWMTMVGRLENQVLHQKEINQNLQQQIDEQQKQMGDLKELVAQLYQGTSDMVLRNKQSRVFKLSSKQ